MIARRWHGRIRTDDAEAYLALMRDVALPDYRAIAGNAGAWCLHRTDGRVTHVEMLTLWDGWDAIERFAGRPADRAKYYDFDRDYLFELDPLVTHFEVIDPQAA